MGKVEALGLAVAVAGLLGTQATDGPAEAEQIATSKEIIGMSRTQFAAWCRTKQAESEGLFESSDETKSTCAWIDRETDEVWHTALHFDGRASTPRQAYTGLIDASGDTVLRLLHNEHGPTDGESADGFPVWRIELDGKEGLLAVAEYEEITLVQIKLPPKGVAVSMR